MAPPPSLSEPAAAAASGRGAIAGVAPPPSLSVAGRQPDARPRQRAIAGVAPPPSLSDQGRRLPCGRHHRAIAGVAPPPSLSEVDRAEHGPVHDERLRGWHPRLH